MSSMNKVILIGNLGKDPEIKTMNNGNKIASFSIATSERWKDKQTGESKEKTEWHNIVVFNEHIIGVVEKYVKKGTKVALEGSLTTRKWTHKDGGDRYSTEIVLQKFKGEIVLLSSKDGEEGSGRSERSSGSGKSAPPDRRPADTDPDDDIPF